MLWVAYRQNIIQNRKWADEEHIWRFKRRQFLFVRTAKGQFCRIGPVPSAGNTELKVLKVYKVQRLNVLYKFYNFTNFINYLHGNSTTSALNRPSVPL